MNAKNIEEWSVSKRWNPFNSYKLLAQVYRWRKIKRGIAIPQPVLVTVDPINACDLRCIWCNSGYVLDSRTGKISKKTLLSIAEFLAEWKASSKWEKGVEAVCIAGGGEPLLNPSVGDFINFLVKKGIEVGVVTNGTMIDKFIEPLSKCVWVGVSVDAGNKKTFERLKGRDRFEKVIKNMKRLVDYSANKRTKLGREGQGYGVSYKYLLHPGNVSEIVDAVKIAKDIGCKNFHLRPMGIPWDKLNRKNDKVFPEEVLDKFRKQIEEARRYEDKKFGVFGITHKFDEELSKANYFEGCHAIFMTAVFMPSTNGNNDHFTLGLCCDRRGDKNLELGKNLSNVSKIKSLWGSEKHWAIFDAIDVRNCPRCTYQPHNQIFEYVIQKDSMTYKFI